MLLSARRASFGFIFLLPFLATSCSAPEETAETLNQELTSAPMFDWSAPDRLQIDATTGLIGPMAYVPQTYPMNFDACGNGNDIVSYVWSVEGDPAVVATGDCRGFSYAFKSEGIFKVSLTLVDARGGAVAVTRDVTVQDWLVVALGDSYGSGEGNPDIPTPESVFEEWLRASTEFAQAGLDVTETDHRSRRRCWKDQGG